MNEKLDFWFTVLESELKAGSSPKVALEKATLYLADVYSIGPHRCDHGIKDGDHCEFCYKSIKIAQLEND